MTAVRTILFVVALALKVLGPPLPPTHLASEELPMALLEVEVEADAEDETSLADDLVAHPRAPDAIALAGAPARREARPPDDPPPAPADRPPNV
jgi:hypothetical protein